MPSVSVIVPIYNVEDYLQECLDSLSAQTYGDFEAVCVIDGSTDSSSKIAERKAEVDSRFKVFYKENGGLSSARNFGMAHARGDFLAFVDADDTVEPQFCEKIVDAFESTQADALVFGASLIPPEASDWWFDLALCPEEKVYEGFSRDLMFSPCNTPFVWRNAVRRDVLADLSLKFDETIPFGEDVVFEFALYPRMKRVASIPDKLYCYRVNREGSLMAERRSDIDRLTAHMSMLKIIYADWQALGLFEEYSADLFNWSRPYLLLGIENLSDSERRHHLITTGSLWHQYFQREDCACLGFESAKELFYLSLIGFEGNYSEVERAYRARIYADMASTSIEPLDVTTLGFCRGDGKLYVKLHVSANAPVVRLECMANSMGNAVPAGTYLLEGVEGGTVQAWVLELPLLQTRFVNVILVPDGRESGRAEMTFDYERAKWLSRMNYLLNPTLCAAIRDIDRNRTFGHYQIDVTHRFDCGDDAVWRFTVKWVGDAAHMPMLRVLDAKGAVLDARPTLFEFQEAAGNEGSRDNKLFMSLKLPRWIDDFVLVAEDGSSDGVEIAAGFAVVYPHRAAILASESRAMLQHAGDVDVRYDYWFDGRRASSDELACQFDVPLYGAPTFEVLVVSPTGAGEAVDETCSSLKRQTYRDFDMHVVPRVDATPFLMSNADYLAFIEAGDILEPNALYEYARTIATSEKRPDILYCDEDVQNDKGGYCHPTFKSRLNIDLHYCSDWVGNLLVVRRDGTFAYGAADTFAAWRYGCTLLAFEQGAEFKHVPHILHHARRRPFLCAQPDILAALKGQLQQHCDRRGIVCEVIDGPEPGSLRIKYALPQSRPLVSVVIPNKDHIDLLDPCLKSILEKSTYDPVEIVIVESNSEDEKTFSYYERIQQEHECVRVVRWGEGFNYSKIVNFGARHAKGEYLLLLNNDTELIVPDSIEEMVGLLQRPEVGVVGAKLLFRDGLVQHAGASMGVFGAVAHVNQNRSVDDGGFMCRATLPGNFSGVTGACQMIRASDFSDLGGYDEEFEVGFNDMDFCMRVLESGLFVTYTPYALLYHYEFSTRGRELADTRKLLRWKREQARFVGKWPEPFVYGDSFTSSSHAKDTMQYQL